MKIKLNLKKTVIKLPFILSTKEEVIVKMRIKLTTQDVFQDEKKTARQQLKISCVRQGTVSVINGHYLSLTLSPDRLV